MLSAAAIGDSVDDPPTDRQTARRPRFGEVRQAGGGVRWQTCQCGVPLSSSKLSAHHPDAFLGGIF
jgi:hypothetical protein